MCQHYLFKSSKLMSTPLFIEQKKTCPRCLANYYLLDQIFDPPKRFIQIITTSNNILWYKIHSLLNHLSTWYSHGEGGSPCTQPFIETVCCVWVRPEYCIACLYTPVGINLLSITGSKTLPPPSAFNTLYWGINCPGN